MKKETLFLYLFLFGYAGLKAQKPQTINMEQAMELAQHNNYSLRASYQQIEAARGNLRSNFFLPQPQIGIQYSEIPPHESPGKSQEKSVYIQQDLSFPLRYPLQTRSLKSQVKAAELNYKQAELSIKVQTRNAYLEWLGSVSLLQLAEENLKIAQEFLSSSQALYDAGEIGAIPLSRAKLSVSQATMQGNTAKNTEIRKRTELLTLMSMPNETILQPTDSLTQFALFRSISFSYDSLQQPTLLYSNALAKQARFELAFQRSGYLPDLSFRYSWQRIDGVSGYYGLSFGVKIPIWFFSQQGSIQKSKAAYRQNLENYRQSKLAYDNQLKAYQQSIPQYESNINEYKEMMEESLSMIQYSKDAYKAGELDYLKYLDAQQTYIQTKAIYINTIVNYQIALTDVFKITGGF